MTRETFERAVDAYCSEIRAKLLRGWALWRDEQAGQMTDPQILSEMRSEAVDVLGWAFWIWLKSRPD